MNIHVVFAYLISLTLLASELIFVFSRYKNSKKTLKNIIKDDDEKKI
ncbi:CcmD-like small membrane protein [Wolbachia endosymbiont of Pentidionis agamae]